MTQGQPAADYVALHASSAQSENLPEQSIWRRPILRVFAGAVDLREEGFLSDDGRIVELRPVALHADHRYRSKVGTLQPVDLDFAVLGFEESRAEMFEKGLRFSIPISEPVAKASLDQEILDAFDRLMFNRVNPACVTSDTEMDSMSVRDAPVTSADVYCPEEGTSDLFTAVREQVPRNARAYGYGQPRLMQLNYFDYHLVGETFLNELTGSSLFAVGDNVRGNQCSGNSGAVLLDLDSIEDFAERPSGFEESVEGAIGRMLGVYGLAGDCNSSPDTYGVYSPVTSHDLSSDLNRRSWFRRLGFTIGGPNASILEAPPGFD